MAGTAELPVSMETIASREGEMLGTLLLVLADTEVGRGSKVITA